MASSCSTLSFAPGPSHLLCRLSRILFPALLSLTPSLANILVRCSPHQDVLSAPDPLPGEVSPSQVPSTPCPLLRQGTDHTGLKLPAFPMSQLDGEFLPLY